jgi:polar amino acid transport system ATP-binding protein
MTAEVLAAIEDLRGEGRDLIVVTHQMAFARRVADRVIFLADGGIVEAGETAQIFDRPGHPRTRDFLAKVLNY